MLRSQTDRKCVIDLGRIEEPLIPPVLPSRYELPSGGPYVGSLTVMMRLGTMLSLFINLVSRHLAAFPLWRLWTSPSSTYPS
jgi:hypothetical protein